MAFSPGLVNVLTCSSNYLAYHKSFHTSRENKPFYSNKRWTIENKLINRSMRSDNLSKFHQRCGASLELAINIILPVCSNKTDALLQGQKNDGATEEIASTFKLVASKHAWCFSETTRSREGRHTGAISILTQDNGAKGIRVIKTGFWWTGGALLFLTLLRWL